MIPRSKDRQQSKSDVAYETEKMGPDLNIVVRHLTAAPTASQKIGRTPNVSASTFCQAGETKKSRPPQLVRWLPERG